MQFSINENRIKRLNNCQISDGRFVLYWMQSSQRVDHNFALNYAIEKANKLSKPLVVFFGITPKFPEANLRHYAFMLEGLKETFAFLKKLGAEPVTSLKSPEIGAVELSRESCLIVVDKGYLKILKQWYKFVAANTDRSLIQVEDNVVVPVGEASTKEEYSAATIRPKIKRKKQQFLSESFECVLNVSSNGLKFNSLGLNDIYKIVQRIRKDDLVQKSEHYKGGQTQALERLGTFISKKLSNYPEHRNDPVANCVSDLSPYLHFGQISPIHIALEVSKSDCSPLAKEMFLEELIVRRELAINFVEYNQNYDSFTGLPTWAKTTLNSHKNDGRNYLYTLEELETAQTHDPYWNAAQNEMRITGKMHGYMRMYWGKKLIEWSGDPKLAFTTALYLNNKYELDGRDPNGFAGVAWCFGKHDRPWKKRPIFGTVRYMNANGLRRKFNIEEYVRKMKINAKQD